MHKNNKAGFGVGLVAFMVLLGLGISKACYGQEEEIRTSPIYSVRQGEILVLQLDEMTCFHGIQPLSIFDRVYQCDPDGRLIIGADFQQPVGTYILDGTNIRIDVVSGNFPEPVYRRRRGRGKKVDEVKRQIERNLMWQAFTQGPTKYPNFPASVEFQMPLDEIVETDPFALERRYYRSSKNDFRKSLHRGVDLATRKRVKNKKTGKVTEWATSGKPVYAVAPGVVMLTGHFTEGGEGKMLVLYHGSGIYSLYLHLDRFKVAKGQVVTKGQVVALSGSTGTSAPHLHFAMKVNTQTVSPLVFIERFNASLPHGRN